MITIIAAVASNGIIGDKNSIPWKIKGEQALFKKFTIGKPIVMGRNTWESLPRKPLPGRKNIVLSTKHLTIEGADLVLPSLAEVVKYHNNEEQDLFIIGGAKLYEDSINHCDELIISHLDESFKGDTYFPEISDSTWQCTYEEYFPKKKGMDCGFTLKKYYKLK